MLSFIRTFFFYSGGFLFSLIHASDFPEPNQGIDDIRPYSSQISEGSIGDNILSLLEEAKEEIIIASDQCTNEEFLTDLETLRKSKEGLRIEIVTGDSFHTQSLFRKEICTRVFDVPNLLPYRDIKMHNKFIIIDKSIVITGSPNLTYAAYNYNIESFVAVTSRVLADLYYTYYQYIICGKDKYDSGTPEFQEVYRKMIAFNQLGSRVKVCLAPILSIKDFVNQSLFEAHIIRINMFLISRGRDLDTDIVSTLMERASDQARITIKIDEEQCEKQDFVKMALEDLRGAGATIYTVKKDAERKQTKTRLINTKPQFHDKLVLIEAEEGIKRLFIGSAGFTDNVQDNSNLENMLLIQDDSTYDFFESHYNVINEGASGLQVKRLFEVEGN